MSLLDRVNTDEQEQFKGTFLEYKLTEQFKK